MHTSELGRFRSAFAVTGGLAALAVTAICVPHARAVLFLAGLAVGLFLVVAVVPIVALALVVRAIGAEDSAAPRRVTAASGLPSDWSSPAPFALRSVPRPAWTGAELARERPRAS